MPELTSEESAVLTALDDAWAVDRLRDLVTVPSVGGTAAESDVQLLMSGWLRELDADVDHWSIDLAAAATADDAPGQEVLREEAWGLVGTLPGSGDEQDTAPALVFCGHVDVVPAGELALWPGDPYTPRVSGGALHGRGACDMKGGLAAALAAMHAVHRSGVRLRRPLALHSVVGEEDGGLGAWATLARGHLGDACVIPEPTAGAVVTANAGALTFRLEVTGRAAHGATREAGVSAVELFLHLYQSLVQFESSRQGDTDERFRGIHHPYGLSIGRVQSGEWASTVPDRLVADGRYGVRLGEPVESARAAFETCVARVSAAHPWLAEHPVRVDWIGGSFASGELPQLSPLLPAVQGAVTQVGGGAAPERAAPYGSDLRLYTAAGVPTLQFGPGDVTLAHAPRESVPVDDVLTTARALALLAVRSCGVR
ncbi:ArgE/DapE family deacylase [Modestobacter sp. I12A-02628]|uniref:ArgE/DapE family deacylase n=1 Tax=Goekera deserti TaxID=2497753 RepID=A0A7K3WIY1_9ACTN|nr:ArgE/DapE family deacylase [Goekera deserti]MPQ99284.1 ArgE/DapE family deacylase [Goekera deserti]NDI50283.1 ArgE/DapE family deacylase [Goekera deserti]NEL56465.1 ArgE/DapE family deacylase [Goekera deserti]